jgi:hypothetical protein
MKLFRILLLAILVSSGVNAQNQGRERTWTYVAITSDKVSEYFIEDASYTYSSGYKSAWIKCKSAKLTIKGRTYYDVTELMLYQIAPGRDLIRIMSVTSYTGKNQIESKQFDFPFMDVIPDSIGEAIYDAIENN